MTFFSGGWGRWLLESSRKAPFYALQGVEGGGATVRLMRPPPPPLAVKDEASSLEKSRFLSKTRLNPLFYMELASALLSALSPPIARVLALYWGFSFAAFSGTALVAAGEEMRARNILR